MLADYVAKARCPWTQRSVDRVRWGLTVGGCGAQKYGAQLGAVEALVKVKGGFSGGTAASMLEMAGQSQPSSGDLRSPFLLNPRGQWSSLRATPLDKDHYLPFYYPVAKCVLCSLQPFSPRAPGT